MKQPTRIIGIDPGLDGALALFSRTHDGLVTLSVADMPTRKIEVNGATKRTIELQLLAHWFDKNFRDVDLCVIEKVHSMPSQGVTSSFNFGFNAGVVQGMAAAFGLPLLLVPPITWKRAMGLTSEKQDSLALARKLFVGFDHYFTRVRDDGRAEASLLALYGDGIRQRMVV